MSRPSDQSARRVRSLGVVRNIAGFALLLLLLLVLGSRDRRARARPGEQTYEYPETRSLVAMVDDAAKVLHDKGTAAFAEFRRPGSPFRKGDKYVFVLDPRGFMLVHPDPAMEGKNEIDLKDLNGKPIIAGLIAAATALPDKPEGWYHYQWPSPGEILPRWKSSYVRLVQMASGKNLIVGAGMYDDRMERSFVVDEVREAVERIEREGKAVFPLFHDPRGPFIAKDAYVFVLDPKGVELVDPAFPNLEGRSILDVKDAQGKHPIREMRRVVEDKGSGWVDYMWPRPGESVPTQKSAYVSKAKLGSSFVIVGCGVYLADAPKAARAERKTTASELMGLVRGAASVLEKRGEAAFPDFRKVGTRWRQDDTYFFVWKMDGTRVLHAADPSLEGRNASASKDVLERPYGKMILDTATSPAGEGWVHYMYPEPGRIFPAWKSAFVKKVTFPSGRQYVVGSGVYDMQMARPIVEDLVDRAAALVAERGKDAFGALRDRRGPFFFMDTYVFVDSPDGTELLNPAQPSLEGRKVSELRDASGRPVAAEYIATAMKEGSGWVEYSWYRPGSNALARKQAFVKKVRSGPETYIVGSGLYVE